MTGTTNSTALRALLAAAGGGLLLAGLRRPSLLARGALALAGGGLIFSALRRGCCADPASASWFDCHLACYGAGVTSGIYDDVAQEAKEERHPAGTFIEDVVEEASDDSFPCSDPPAWTARASDGHPV